MVKRGQYVGCHHLMQPFDHEEAGRRQNNLEVILGTIGTPRLELVPSTVQLLDAEIESNQRLALELDAVVPDDWPPGEYDRPAIQTFRDRLADNPADTGWYSWYAILRSDDSAQRLLVGAAGFMGPPDRDGLIEIGYSVVPSYGARGFATEMVEGLVRRAFSDTRVKRIVAHTTPGNAASIKILKRLGFEYAGSGKEVGTVQYERRAPAA